jgi:hypothetical protein
VLQQTLELGPVLGLDELGGGDGVAAGVLEARNVRGPAQLAELVASRRTPEALGRL